MTFIATAGVLLLLTLVGASLVAVLSPKPEQPELPDADPDGAARFLSRDGGSCCCLRHSGSCCQVHGVAP